MSKPVTFDTVVVRFGGELWLKKTWTRRRYIRCLIENMKRVLKRYNVEYGEVMRRRGRLLLKTTSAVEATSKLSRVFGISSVSPALEVGSNKLEDVANKCVFLASHVLSEGNSFAVRCRRVGEHPYSSKDVCREVGRRVLDAFDETRSLTVDLKRPDVVLGVEVRGDEAFVFGEVVKGVGGMPLGTQGRVVCLLSGGVDSAVAGWLVMKRGCQLVPLYFDCKPYTDEIATERAMEIAKVLSDWAVGFPRRLYVVPHGHVLGAIVEKCPRRLTCLLCKRMMYRVAEVLADQVRAEGIVTGEAIGEQASQTIQNLRVLDEAAKMYPVHRPLLGFDKAETEGLARKIEAYKITARNVQGCKAAPHKPATKAKLKEIVEAEARLNIDEMVERCVGELKVVDL
ncbi:MAG: tRNA 4-thiouridine(8) synthase ThiI [Candidatus Bathyarchaeota archaeon]|nr:tRNA 4-thiouridine(8) synthase ThiI [Candidatus Bathyarchaeota archaeon]